MDALPAHPPERPVFYRRLADLVLVLGVLASVLGWQHSAQTLRDEHDRQFDAVASEKVARIVDSVERYMDLAGSLSALFEASQHVSRREFHEHFRSLRALDRYPALQALQYAPRVSHAERAQFEASVRADTSLSPQGYPEFRIHPPGQRDEYFPVLYNEPMQGNEAALGHDQAAEATRRAALERARDTRRPALSAPLMLQQKVEPTRGFVIRSALFAEPSATQDGAGEPVHVGQVSVVLRAADLLRYALVDHDASRYHVRITDIGDQNYRSGQPVEPRAVVLRGDEVWSYPYEPPPQVQPEDQRVHVKAVGGRMWEVVITRRPIDVYTEPYPLTVLLGGVAGSIVLWMALRVFAGRYTRATALARYLSRQAKESEARLRSVIDGTVDGIITFDHDGRIVDVNAAAARMFGATEAQLRGASVNELLPPTDTAREGAGVALAWAAGPVREVTGLRRDGLLFPLELAVSDVQLDGRPHRVAMLRDISERRATELAMEESQRQLRRADALRRTIYDSAPFAIVALDLRGVIQAMNPAAEMLLGYSADELVGRATPALYHDPQEIALRASQLSAELGEPVPAGVEVFIARARRGRPDEREWTCIRKDGRRTPVILVMTALSNEAGEPAGYLGISYDVTERKRAEEHIRHMAHHDALTDLPNRVLLQERLSAALTRARRESDCVALMFIDLDRFKNINDSLGHHVGDGILRIVAERLRATVRASDTVARMGGDEFVVLLPKVAHVDDCQLVARKMIAALGAPMQVGPHLLRVTPSIGVATFPEAGSDPATLMRAADAAMYHAKAAGRNNVKFYDESMTRDSADRLRMENDLHEAIDRGEMRVYYQPQFDCASGALVGAEALLRWERPGHGLVPPGEFVMLAEDTGLIVPIGAWVLREACMQARRWEQATGQPLRVAVNLSPRQLESEDLLQTVAGALEAAALPAWRLELEITESAIVRDTLSTATVLARLRALGISIAIDDFGIGYSSLAYLRELPVDKFKIDRSFLVGVPGSSSDARLTAAVIAMAHTLQVGLVAEGVQTREQLDFLREHGCHEAQGHYLGRPMPAEDFEALIRRVGVTAAAPS